MTKNIEVPIDLFSAMACSISGGSPSVEVRIRKFLSDAQLIALIEDMATDSIDLNYTPIWEELKSRFIGDQAKDD